MDRITIDYRLYPDVIDQDGNPSGFESILDIESKKGGPGSGNFGHSGRPGQWGGSAPAGIAAFRAQEKTPEFKKWFGKSQVVDENKKPKMVYHGTTHEFSAFDIDKANVENYLGKGFYFTDNPDDASVNYAGEGPDLTNRLTTLAENFEGGNLQDVIMGSFNKDLVNNISKITGVDPDEVEDKVGEGELELNHEQALQLARLQMDVQHEGAIIPAYLKMENPMVIKPKGGTYFDSPEMDDDGNFVDEEEPSARMYHSVEQVLADNGIELSDPEIAISIFDGDSAYNLIRRLKRDEGLSYHEDENGNLDSDNLIGDMIAGAGFDGIIMDAGSSDFSNMKHVRGTTHYILWDPKHIKSYYNLGKFNPNDPGILKGGRGSGNYGHAGRPGLWGGSQASGVHLAKGADLPSDWKGVIKYFAGDIDPYQEDTPEKTDEEIKARQDRLIKIKKAADIYLDHVGFSKTEEEITHPAHDIANQIVAEMGEKGYMSLGMQTSMDIRHALSTGYLFRVKREISAGRMTPEEGQAIDSAEIHPDHWKPLPNELWHATTNAQAILASGLKSRYEQSADGGVGLGGGENDTISLTSDKEYARTIERGLHEMHLVTTGKVTPRDLVEFAKAGSGGVGHDWSNVLQRFQKAVTGIDDMDDVLDRIEGKKQERVSIFSTETKPYSQKDLDYYKTSFLSSFMAARQEAGGYENPMFMFNNIDAFKKLDPSGFGVIRLKPASKKAKGTYFWAEREYRIVGGKAVKPAEIIHFFKPDDISAIFGLKND